MTDKEDKETRAIEANEGLMNSLDKQKDRVRDKEISKIQWHLIWLMFALGVITGLGLAGIIALVIGVR